MKLLILFTTVACLQVSANGYGQPVSLSLSNAPLEQAFKEIKKQTGFSFVYTRDQLKNTSPVNCQLKNAELREALDICFRNQPLSFVIEDHYIVVQTKVAVTQSPTQQLPIDIKGRVVNENGEPVVGASVKIKGTQIGTSTNDNGEFTLNVLMPDMILIISAVNIETSEVRLNARTNLTISIKTSIKPLDEIIARGYYNTSRRLNTGTVSKVTSEEISKQPVSNPLAALEGRVPGLFITQGTGLPGSNFTILIRGRNSIQNGNSPLYLIDGVPFLTDKEYLTQRNGINTSNPFNSINPDDIESIEILKDADATAIYGSRGANGVVLITTKKGKAGKSKVDFNMYEGWGKVTRTMSYLNTQQYLQMRREAFTNDGIIPDASNAPDLLLWDTTRFTDWKKLLIGGTAHSTNSQIRLSGGNPNTSFSIGANYYKETTVFPGNFADSRSSVNLGIVHNSDNKKFNATISASYAYDKSNLLREDLTGYISNPPDMYKPYDSLGRLKWSEGGYSAGNPLAILLQKYSGITDRLTGNGILSYKILQGLNIKTSFGYNYVGFDETALFPIAAQNPSYNPKGSANFANNAVRTWIIEPQAEYSKNIGTKGKLSVLLGATWQESKNKSNILTGTGYTNDNLINSIAGAATITSSNDYNQYRYQAVFGRINYNFDEKYLVNFTGRRDGSSRFGPNKRFANFGALGLGWVFSREKFIQKIFPFLSFGKLRGSYGITGNDQIKNYQYLDTWTNTQYPYQGQPALLPSRLFNPDYSWEQNRKMELAIEIGLLHDRILVGANWYHNQSDNQIIKYDLPAQAGGNPALSGTSILKNFPGVVQNNGFEIELNTINIKNRHFAWNTSFNITISRNKLVKFPGLITSSYGTTYIIGKPLNINYAYHYLGVDPQTGIYKMQDVNNDNQLNNKDYLYGGTYDPVFFGGLQNSFQYKGWQLTFLLQFTRQMGTDPIFSSYTANGDIINQPIAVLNHWKKPGDNVPYERYTQDFSNPAYYPAIYNIAASDAILTNASFIRLKNLAVSYIFPESWIKSIKMEKCKLYFQAQNLLTITKYKGADPESQNPSSLPPLRMFTTGIQFIF